MAMRENTIMRLTMELQNMNAICREFKGNKKDFSTKEYTEYETDQNPIKYGNCDIVPFVYKSSFFLIVKKCL